METKFSPPYSQQPATCAYTEPHQCSPRHILFFEKSILKVSSHTGLGFPLGLLPTSFPTKILYAPILSPIHVTCPIRLILLDLIARIKLCEKYRWRNFSLCSSHSLRRPSLAHISIGTLFSDTLRLCSSLSM